MQGLVSLDALFVVSAAINVNFLLYCLIFIYMNRCFCFSVCTYPINTSSSLLCLYLCCAYVLLSEVVEYQAEQISPFSLCSERWLLKGNTLQLIFNFIRVVAQVSH